MNLLATREAEGKGMTANTIISITDCEGISEDKLVVIGRLESKNPADISDDNETFGSILYSVILGDDAYRNGYCKTLNMSFPYLYKRFQSMLEYAHTKYFGKKQIDKNNLISAFEAALKSCIIEFIDTKCIVVY